MVSAILISASVAFSLGCICTLLAFDCPKCKCNDEPKKQLLKG